MHALSMPYSSRKSAETLPQRLPAPPGCCRLLVTLKETNQAAFAALLQHDLEGLLPLVYTPTIGEACMAWGSLLPRPTGLYITSSDRWVPGTAVLVLPAPQRGVCCSNIRQLCQLVSLVGDCWELGLRQPAATATWAVRIQQ
jgi:hypothetical protein